MSSEGQVQIVADQGREGPRIQELGLGIGLGLGVRVRVGLGLGLELGLG